jgi:hypothetical protein
MSGGDNEASQIGHLRPCEVCILNRGDHTLKQNVKWCGVCQKWRCYECRNSIVEVTKGVVNNFTVYLSTRRRNKGNTP